jgi:hypothetical protein
VSDSINITDLEKKAADLEVALKEVRLLIELARKYAPQPNPVQPAGAVVMSVTRGLADRGMTKQKRIFKATLEILSDGKRRLSRDLIPELEKRGVIVGGKNPKSLLASYLSTAPDVFESDVKLGGWMIRLGPAKKARPDEVAASSGLFSSGSEATHHAVSARKEDAEFG